MDLNLPLLLELLRLRLDDCDEPDEEEDDEDEDAEDEEDELEEDDEEDLLRLRFRFLFSRPEEKTINQSNKNNMSHLVFGRELPYGIIMQTVT